MHTLITSIDMQQLIEYDRTSGHRSCGPNTHPYRLTYVRKLQLTTNNATHPHTQAHALSHTHTPIETPPYNHPTNSDLNLTLLSDKEVTVEVNKTVADLRRFALPILGINNSHNYLPEFLPSKAFRFAGQRID